MFLESSQLKREQTDDGPSGQDIRSLAVVGAGFMGAGIAQSAAMNGMTVRLRDVDDASVAAGLNRVHRLTLQARQRRRIDRYEASAVENRLSGSTTYSGFRHCDLAVEAAVERVEVKQQIVADLEEVMRPDAVIGSNTSAIPISVIAARASRPERVVGIHFFSPVHRMPLVEVVRGEKSSARAVATAVAFGRKLGKHVVVVRDRPGFYTTRVLGFMMSEAVRVFEEGAEIQDVDAAMVEFGFPVGPMALMDEVGLDVAHHVAGTLAAAFPDRMQRPALMQSLAGTDRRGRKSGRGFYVYEDGRKEPDSSIGTGIERRSVARSEIQERLSLIFVNEAAHCLDEAIVAGPRDGDIAAVFGLGFPAFLGGPFRYVDTVGAGLVADRLRSLAARFGPRFQPAAALEGAALSQSFFRESSRNMGGSPALSPQGELIGVHDPRLG